MLCKSVSQAFFRSLLLFLTCAVPLLAPDYENDTLSQEAVAAIKRTYTLEAQLKQDSQTNPANEATNKQKIAVLAQARAELARVYSTPLSTQDSHGGAEHTIVTTARNALVEKIPASYKNLTTKDLRTEVETFTKAKSAVEQKRKEAFTSAKKDLEALQEDVNTAEEQLRKTGDTEAFLKAQALHQKMLRESGPLKSVNGLSSSAELAQADLVRATHARAVQIIKEEFDKTRAHDLLAKLTIAEYALTEHEETVRQSKAAAQAVEQGFAVHRKKAAVDARIPSTAAEGEGEAGSGSGSGSGSGAGAGAGDASASAGRDASAGATELESEGAVIERHKKLLNTEKVRYENLVKQKTALTPQQQQLSQQLQRMNAEINTRHEVSEAGEALTHLSFTPSMGQDFLYEQRDELAKRLGEVRQNLNAAKELEIVQRDLDEITRVEALAEDSPERAAAAKTELSRELKARDLFESQMRAKEYERLSIPTENEARRAAATQLFNIIDSSAFKPYQAHSLSSLARPDTIARAAPSELLSEAFTRLKPNEQIELTKLLEDPEAERREGHPFKKFLDAAQNFEQRQQPEIQDETVTHEPGAGAASGASTGADSPSATDGGAEGAAKKEYLFAKIYTKKSTARQAQLASPLTRAKWYKDNHQLFAQLRQQVDKETNRADEETAVRKVTTDAQNKKADVANHDAKQIRDADLAELEKYRTDGGTQLTLEQARQRRILTNAPKYYEAIAETLTRLRSDLSETGATEILDAFHADPAAFLTQRSALVRLDDLEDKSGEPLRIFRIALAKQGIEFWRDEDVAPEITSALNLLKNPQSASNEVKTLVGRLPQSLGDAVASGDISNVLRKIKDKNAHEYNSPVTGDHARSRIRSAAELAEDAQSRKTTGNNLSAEMASRPKARNQQLNMNKFNDLAALSAQKHPAKMDDLTAASGSAEGVKPVAHLFIMFNAEGHAIAGPTGTTLMTSEENATALLDDASKEYLAVDIDLTDMDPDQLRLRLKEALQGQVEAGQEDILVEHCLPKGNTASLEHELNQLRLQRAHIVPLEQERMRAAAELQAARRDPELTSLNVTLDDEGAGVVTGDDEDTAIRKMIKHFDLAKADHEKTYATDESDELDESDEQLAKKRETHAYLLSIIDNTRNSLENEDYPLSEHNRTLLLALHDEAIQVLQRPEIHQLNLDENFDPQEELMNLVATHKRTVEQQTMAEEQRAEDLKTNPSAALKYSELQKARLKYEDKLKRIRESLVPEFSSTEVTEVQKARARADRLAAQKTFDEEAFELNKQIKADLESESEDRIKALEEEATTLSKRIKLLTKDTPEQAEAVAKFEELKALRTEEERVRPLSVAARHARKTVEAEASTARSSRFTASLSSRDSGVSNYDAKSIARSVVGARKSARKEMKANASRLSSRASSARMARTAR